MICSKSTTTFRRSCRRCLIFHLEQSTRIDVSNAYTHPPLSICNSNCSTLAPPLPHHTIDLFFYLNCTFSCLLIYIFTHSFYTHTHTHTHASTRTHTHTHTHTHTLVRNSCKPSHIFTESFVPSHSDVNVLPNTATRVPLSLIDGDETSDFINANFVSGYGWPKR